MSNARQLHREAINMVNEAHSALELGEEERYGILLRGAFEKERAAAWELLYKPESEPTRSVLFRSAARLAVDCREFKEAEKLVAAALFGPDVLCWAHFIFKIAVGRCKQNLRTVLAQRLHLGRCGVF